MGIIIHEYPHRYSNTLYPGLWTKFIGWCSKQEANRLGWLAASFIVHGCIFVPMTIVFIAVSGAGFIYVTIAVVSMITAVTVSLADLRMRVTLPVFFSSLLVDLIIIAIRLTQGLNIHRLFTR